MSRHIRQKNKTHVARANQENFEIYLQYLRRGMLPTKAARAVPISADRIRERRRSDPVFAQHELDAIMEFSEEVEQVLIDAAFGVVHYAKDADGNDVYDEKGRRVPAARDTKSALEWLKARNSSIFNVNRQVDVNVTHTVDAKELMSDISALTAKLEQRALPAADDIVDAEVVD